jgi:dienelactone hydrolase
VVSVLSKTNVDWQVHEYGRAVHAFTNPGAEGEGMAYNALADQRSWNAMMLCSKKFSSRTRPP